MIQRRHFLGLLGTIMIMFFGCQRKTKSVGLTVGQLIPTFKLVSLDNVTIAVSSATGPYLLNFWATWCPPCRAEMGGLNRAHAVFAPRGLNVLGISVDEDIFLVREYILKEKLSFPILFDRNGDDAVRKLLQVDAYPTTFLVNKKGQVVEIMTGEQDWDSESVRQRLERLID